MEHILFWAMVIFFVGMLCAIVFNLILDFIEQRNVMYVKKHEWNKKEIKKLRKMHKELDRTMGIR